MLMFIIGFLVAWFLLGILFYARDGAGGWSIWMDSYWDIVLMMLPAIPAILLIKFIQEKISKNS